MRIVGYCRVSTEREEQINSLQNQKFFFSEYANKNGHTLVGIYADEGISGTSLKKRKEFQRLMNDAKLGIFDMVVVKDISRFSRNTVDFLQSIRTLKSLGITTLFLSSNMDSLGESEFILAVFSALAQEESINLSKRIKFGKNINAQKGSVPQLIYGYDRIDQYNLKINEEEASVIRKIFYLYVDQGLGCRRICDQLNEQCYKTKLGYEWNPRGVNRILNNSIYCGDYVNHKFEVENCLEGNIISRPIDEHIHHDRKEWEIISKDKFNQAQQQLKKRSNSHKSNNDFKSKYSSKYTFSSIIKCEQCGRSFVQKKYKRKQDERVYWKCSTYDQYGERGCSNKSTIDEKILLSQIWNFYISQISNIEQFKREISSQIVNTSNAKKSKDTDKKYRFLISKKNRYLDLFSEGFLTKEQLKYKINNLDLEISQITQKNINILDNCMKSEENCQYKIEAIINLERINNSDVRKLVDTITVNREGIIKIFLKGYYG